MQGAMIGGFLLPEKEFKDIVKQLFLNIDYVKYLENIIDRALKNIHSKNIRAAYKNIEEFETEIFKNPSVSIMLITNLNSDKGQYKQAQNKNEKNVIRKSGKISYSQTIKNNLLNEEITSILSEHLLNLIKMIDTTELSDEQINNLFKLYKFQNKENKRIMGSQAYYSRNLKEIIYGDNPQYKGQIADAFLNHLGNMHKELFSGRIENMTPFLQTVMEEEGANFYQLLIDSTNNTPQYTGGDLILLNSNGEVIANIQLKTIINEKSSTIGKITSKTLEANLLKLKELIQSDNILDADIFADKLYNMFATSGIIDNVNDEIINYAKIKVQEIFNLT